MEHCSGTVWNRMVEQWNSVVEQCEKQGGTVVMWKNVVEKCGTVC